VLAAGCGRGDDPARLCDTDVIIDFSVPEGTLALLEAVPNDGPPLVCGVTGWRETQMSRLREHAGRTCILHAPNFSTGVLALRHLLRTAAPLLARLGYTPVVCETHHRHKRDAPSGTALALCRDIAPDDPASVQTHAVRAGEVIGDHQVTFYGPGDRIQLAHQAQDRTIFARGAIEAACWLADRPRTPGLLSLDDYLQDQLAPAQEVGS
jgi:4-hydroxy-tetrahydrodipicolinate reductase